MLSVRCPVCLSVCLSVCPVCNVRALWPNGWTDQDETWQADRPRPWPHCAPSPKRAQPPNFQPISAGNGCMDQDATWYGAMGLGPGDFVLDGDPTPPPKWGGAPSPIFGHFYCGQTVGCIKMPLGMEVGLSPGDFVLDGELAP